MGTIGPPVSLRRRERIGLIQEGFPLVALGAMRAGPPVVGYSTGVGEQVEHGVTGYLADSGDASVRYAQMISKIESAHQRVLGPRG